MASPVSFANLSKLQLNRPTREVSPIFAGPTLITSCTEQTAILPRGLGISFFRGCRKQDTSLFAAFGHTVSCQIKLSECNFRRRVALRYCFLELLRCCGAVSHTASVTRGLRRFRQFGGPRICRRRLDRGGQGRVFQSFARRYLATRLAGDRAVVLNRAGGQLGRRVRRWRHRLIYLHQFLAEPNQRAGDFRAKILKKHEGHQSEYGNENSRGGATHELRPRWRHLRIACSRFRREQTRWESVDAGSPGGGNHWVRRRNVVRVRSMETHLVSRPLFLSVHFG
ncbi:MAG: hypothetical protein JWN63_1531 [Candidatus Acidoferrum typicum]|nr:hypothetical protein [Candidatus Acidoferrum typicum]